MDAVPTPCLACGYRAPRRLCDRCVTSVDADLAALSGLYRKLGTVMTPGTGTGPRVSGSKQPPLPVRLEPLSLRAHGGIVGVLGDWEADWRERLHWTRTPFRGKVEQRVDGAVTFLRNNWLWCVDDHPVPEVFATEIHRLAAECRTQVEGKGDARPIGYCPVVCADDLPCGTKLWADPYVEEIRCRGCRTVWGSSRWLELAVALHG